MNVFKTLSCLCLHNNLYKALQVLLVLISLRGMTVYSWRLW